MLSYITDYSSQRGSPVPSEACLLPLIEKSPFIGSANPGSSSMAVPLSSYPAQEPSVLWNVPSAFM